MYQISVQTYFAAAHFLRHYRGKCENLHGHNWKVEVTVAASALDKAGMAIDFSVLKEKVHSVIEPFDHSNLNESSYFSDLNPSSENIAALIFKLLTHELQSSEVTLTKVSVWESESSVATYIP